MCVYDRIEASAKTKAYKRVTLLQKTTNLIEVLNQKEKREDRPESHVTRSIHRRRPRLSSSPEDQEYREKERGNGERGKRRKGDVSNEHLRFGKGAESYSPFRQCQRSPCRETSRFCQRDPEE